MPASPAAEAVAALAGEAGADDMPGGLALRETTLADAREKAPRRSRTRRVREQPTEPEAELVTRPLAAAPPVSMPAAPGVPAAIFQAPA